MEGLFNLIIVESPFLFQTHMWIWMADMDANPQPATVLISRPQWPAGSREGISAVCESRSMGHLPGWGPVKPSLSSFPRSAISHGTWPTLLFLIQRNLIFLPLKPRAPLFLSAWLSSKLLLKTVNQAKRRKDGGRYKQLFVSMRKWKAGNKSQRVHL